MKDVQSELHGLNRKLERGEITPDQWADQFDSLLLKGHSHAVQLGTARGGGALLSDAEVLKRARGAKDEEAEFLQGFLDAIHNKDPRYFDDEGKYRPGSMDQRTSLYVGKMRGTANDAMVEASDDDAQWIWELGGEMHCPDCPQIAAGSPYEKDTLYTTPGSGDTDCLGNCDCVLVRSDGVRGFPRAHLDSDITSDESTAQELEPTSSDLAP